MDEEEVYGFRGPRARWIRWELAILLVFWFCAFVAPAIPELIGPNQPYLYPPLTWRDSFYFGGVLIFPAWVIWMSGDAPEMFGLARLRFSDLYWSIALLVLTVADHVTSGFLYHRRIRSPGDGPATMATFFGSMEPEKFLPGLAIYLLPAAFEELFFRGLIQSRIMEISNNAWAAVGGSAFFFAVGHAYQGAMVLPAHLVTGLILGFFRLKGCSLWVLIVAHAVANALVDVITVVPEFSR